MTKAAHKTAKVQGVAEAPAVFAAAGANMQAAVALKEAQSAGLLDGEKDAHVSFRAPKALVEAAMRRSGAKGMTEMGTIALAMLAQEDPLADYMRKNRGVLGPDHTLEF